MNSAILESLDLVSFLYQQDQIELRHELSASSPIIRGSLGKLQQVLMNLLSNARDAMEEADTRVITVSTRELDGEIVVDVADTGCGISENNLERVFVSGYTSKPVGKGSGMGLDLVRTIIGGMDGSISVSSRPGEGTVFRIVFPRFSA